MLQVMAGYDPKDPSTVNRPVPDMLAAMDGSLDGVRIGVPTSTSSRRRAWSPR